MQSGICVCPSPVRTPRLCWDKSQVLSPRISLLSPPRLREQAAGQLVLISESCCVRSGDYSRAKVSPGKACCHSCHSTVHTVGLTLLCFHFFLFFQQHLARLLLISNSRSMWGELACLCRSVCKREKKSWIGGSWQLLCAPSLRWQMCHIVGAATCSVDANRLTAAPFVTRLSLFSLFVIAPRRAFSSQTTGPPICHRRKHPN